MKASTQTVNIRARLNQETDKWLRERAQKNFRSVNAELLACIEMARREVEETEKARLKRRS